MNNPYEFDEVVTQRFGLLGKVLEESCVLGNQSDYRLAFVYRHARNIYSLGQDVVLLLESGRLDSCQIIVRAMLESLFKLMAAVRQPEAAVQILIREVEADCGRMELLDPIECAPGIKQGLEFTAKLRREYNVTSKKKWSTYDCAEAADLIHRYRGDYVVFSGHSHASTGGVIMQEKQIGAGHALESLLYIVLCTSGGFAQVIQTASPQAHIDEAARLMKILVGLIKGGIFKELDRDLDES